MRQGLSFSTITSPQNYVPPARVVGAQVLHSYSVISSMYIVCTLGSNRSINKLRYQNCIINEMSCKLSTHSSSSSQNVFHGDSHDGDGSLQPREAALQKAVVVGGKEFRFSANREPVVILVHVVVIVSLKMWYICRNIYVAVLCRNNTCLSAARAKSRRGKGTQNPQQLLLIQTCNNLLCNGMVAASCFTRSRRGRSRRSGSCRLLSSAHNHQRIAPSWFLRKSTRDSFVIKTKFCPEPV